MAELAVLELDGVGKTFRERKRTVEALHEVSFRVRRGAITGLIGPDGAGKTTLMRLAAGLLRPDTGRLRVLGLDATAQALEVQARLGYMPQRFGLYEDLSVQENLDLYADLQGVPRGERAPRYRRLVRMTGLAPFTRRLAGRLSGGMKQKLGLACTLVRAPELLLLDEPTVGVDPVSRRELWSIVGELLETEGMSVLLSTAYLDEAARCAEVILLHQGRVLGQGSPESFREPLAGRSFRLSGADPAKRSLQQRLMQAPGVIDAVVQAEGLRLVLAAADTETAPLLRDLPGARIEPVPPRFEDAFVARLQRQRPEREAPRAPAGTASRRRGRADNGPMIRVRDLRRRFGDFWAVDGLDFEVAAGEVFGLLGANGAGKSTTFRMLCGLLPPSGGELAVAGADLRRAAASARARIGYMSQRFSLYGQLTVRQNLDFFAHSYGLDRRRRRERMDWALATFELADQTEVDAQRLPLGHKQRLALAAALLHEPDILFLDEPTSGVDPLMRREFWARISALAESGVTVMVTTHFMEEAEYCDRLAIMAQGRLLALGTPEEIKRRTHSGEGPLPDMEEAFIRLVESTGPDEAAA